MLRFDPNFSKIQFVVVKQVMQTGVSKYNVKKEGSTAIRKV